MRNCLTPKKNKINIKYESHENENWLLNTDLFIGDFGGSTILGLYFNVPTILLDPPNMSDQKKLLFKNMKELYPLIIIHLNPYPE